MTVANRCLRSGHAHIMYWIKNSWLMILYLHSEKTTIAARISYSRSLNMLLHSNTSTTPNVVEIYNAISTRDHRCFPLCITWQYTVTVTCIGLALYGHVVVRKVYLLIESRCRDVSRKQNCNNNITHCSGACSAAAILKPIWLM